MHLRAIAVACLVLLAGVPVPANAEVDVTGDLTVAAFSVTNDRVELRVAQGASTWDPAAVVLRTPPSPPGARTFLLSGATGLRPALDTTAMMSTVDWKLTGVSGPGTFSAFTTDVAGKPSTLFDSADGMPDTHTVAPGTRERISWAFTAPGRYELSFEAATTLESGGQATTTTRYHIEVVPGSPHAAPPPEVKAPPKTKAPPEVRAPKLTPLQAPPPALAAKAAAGTVLADGHVDVAGRLVDGAMRIDIGDDSTGQHRWLNPCEVVFHVRPAARIEVPDDPNFAFLGNPGEAVWVLSQEQQQDLLWPGWSTENVPAADITGPVKWTMTGVDGPDTFWLFVVGGLGETNIFFNSKDGLPDTLDVPAGTHAHGNWAFKKEGTYRLTFEMSATLKSGATVQNKTTLAVAVGAIDPATVTPGPCSAPPPSSTTTTTTTATTTTKAGLASTGVRQVPSLLGGAAVLLLIGAVLVVVTRRRAR